MQDQSRIVIVGSPEGSASVVDHLLRFGYENVSTVASIDGLCARRLPALLVALLQAGGVERADFTQYLSRCVALPRPAVLAICPPLGTAEKIDLLNSGVDDLMSDPPDAVELYARVRNLVELHANRAHRRGAPNQKDWLLTCLAQIERVFDPMHACEAVQIADLTVLLARECGWDSQVLNLLHQSARVYDFGMLAIPEALRKSQGCLTPEEKDQMRKHPLLASEMFADLSDAGIAMVRDIASAHHERWDGTGYPNGLHGTDIPESARLVAVAQTYVALQQPRPYRPAYSRQQALEEIRSQRGLAFDPVVVAALDRLVCFRQTA